MHASEGRVGRECQGRAPHMLLLKHLYLKKFFTFLLNMPGFAVVSIWYVRDGDQVPQMAGRNKSVVKIPEKLLLIFSLGFSLVRVRSLTFLKFNDILFCKPE